MSLAQPEEPYEGGSQEEDEFFGQEPTGRRLGRSRVWDLNRKTKGRRC